MSALIETRLGDVRDDVGSMPWLSAHSEKRTQLSGWATPRYVADHSLGPRIEVAREYLGYDRSQLSREEPYGFLPAHSCLLC